MGMLKEFKEFAMKGNVVDMAVGIIIGAAFGKIVSSFVADVITPPLGFLLGGMDFTGLQITLKEASATAPAVTLKYGTFFQTVFDFLIVAMAMFAVIKAMNTIRKKKEAVPEAAPAPTPQEKLLSEIRDILKEGPSPVRKAS